MKKKYFFGPIILALVLFAGVVLVPVSWLAKLVPEDRLEESATSLESNMFQGTYLQSEMLKHSTYVPIYGSSELSRWDPFHPSNYFEMNAAVFTPYLIGKGGMTSIIHDLNFATHADQLKNKQMVIIVSPQWFVKHGTDEQHFTPNYSALQAYQLPFNKEVDEQVKRKLMQRLITYDAVKNDTILYQLYDAYLNDKKVKFNIFSVSAKAYISLLKKKDLYFTLLKDKPTNRHQSNEVKDKTWEELQAQADAYGEKRTQHSKFYIDDNVYKYRKHYIKGMKGKNKGHSYAESLEYEDFQLMLDILKEANADPLFVIIPVNGAYYDYTGFPEKGRQEYYTRIKKQINDSGFTYADYSDHEYDPHFMRDTIHIGWKGWVYLNEDMQKFLE
ncbi:D-alanyl-lipoteichoic acid biosynthesis protein DltD [Virgibacillus sp. AGTR]|uniref:D-alanyl-lipoteichoic acid biosynthesis protein DltD n=1 Tax=Virgibacillus sp. AGTR TaxID=2812055 RepID=UPI001966B086|nr:D-alanyl-lipoteichoic acid biosynthesis protein DltD [Virgibacillus sp. AGTR]MCC2250400.1 D-alanyl-lipoteichoic acid biosynthesis protein DltD [Virgibacillus sp. AGTR]QRZ18873.1 D-alanyl-lipoteichoic acid biosynthesis protein DltD [Virgibacillus sp. AGTR]